MPPTLEVYHVPPEGRAPGKFVARLEAGGASGSEMAPTTAVAAATAASSEARRREDQARQAMEEAHKAQADAARAVEEAMARAAAAKARAAKISAAALEPEDPPEPPPPPPKAEEPPPQPEAPPPTGGASRWADDDGDDQTLPVPVLWVDELPPPAQLVGGATSVVAVGKGGRGLIVLHLLEQLLVRLRHLPHFLWQRLLDDGHGDGASRELRAVKEQGRGGAGCRGKLDETHLRRRARALRARAPHTPAAEWGAGAPRPGWRCGRWCRGNRRGR